jgi:hypothetical protein
MFYIMNQGIFGLELKILQVFCFRIADLGVVRHLANVGLARMDRQTCAGNSWWFVLYSRQFLLL